MTRTRIGPATLARDARNRALRTLAQSALVAALVALVQAIVAWSSGGRFDVRLLVGSVITAAAVPVVAFLHRLELDPTGLPSLTPPTDPIVTAKQRGDAQRLGVTTLADQGGHATAGYLAGGLLLIVVLLLIVHATYWLTGTLGVIVVILLVAALLL